MCAAQSVCIATPTCPFCRRLTTSGRTCTRCRQDHFLTGARSQWYYKEPIKRLIHAYKYESLHRARDYVVPEMIRLFNDLPLNPARVIITSVPSNSKRMIERGYNQSELLAKDMASACRTPYHALLMRNANTVSQTKLSRRERLANVASQFHLLPSDTAIIAHRDIVIIDDVLTTGATLSACARILKDAGARQVWALTIAHD